MEYDNRASRVVGAFRELKKVVWLMIDRAYQRAQKIERCHGHDNGR
jgi:hypothetical protein